MRSPLIGPRGSVNVPLLAQVPRVKLVEGGDVLSGRLLKELFEHRERLPRARGCAKGTGPGRDRIRCPIRVFGGQ